MEYLKPILWTLSVLLALPFAVIFCDILMFRSMKEEDQIRYLEGKKDLANHLARNNITPDKISAALGQVYSKASTIHHYRYALEKAVRHIRKTPML